MTTVQKIHLDFNTAADKLIEQANGCLEKDSNAERMLKLGFISAKRVKLHEKLTKTREWADFALKYTVKYPMYKFITQEQVDKLCHKWNLVIGSFGEFIADVPEKNLSDIESFKVQAEDIQEMYSFFSEWHSGIYERFILGYDPRSNDEKPKKETIKLEPKVSFSICAPQKDFNMEGKKIKGNKIVPEDQIVLAKVKGGYLIVTAWGGEASDEIVVNQANN